MSKPRLDPEFKAKWLKALRGKKYKQGYGYLRHDGAYCCLGVACDLTDSEAWNSYGSWHGKDAEVPQRKIKGLTSKVQEQLINLNDVKGASFKTIAKWVEENL